MHPDPLVGLVISFGLAGLFSELFGDVATGVTPLGVHALAPQASAA